MRSPRSSATAEGMHCIHLKADDADSSACALPVAGAFVPLSVPLSSCGEAEAEPPLIRGDALAQLHFPDFGKEYFIPRIFLFGGTRLSQSPF